MNAGQVNVMSETNQLNVLAEKQNGNCSDGTGSFLISSSSSSCSPSPSITSSTSSSSPSPINNIEHSTPLYQTISHYNNASNCSPYLNNNQVQSNDTYGYSDQSQYVTNYSNNGFVYPQQNGVQYEDNDVKYQRVVQHSFRSQDSYFNDSNYFTKNNSSCASFVDMNSNELNESINKSKTENRILQQQLQKQHPEQYYNNSPRLPLNQPVQVSTKTKSFSIDDILSRPFIRKESPIVQASSFESSTTNPTQTCNQTDLDEEAFDETTEKENGKRKKRCASNQSKNNNNKRMRTIFSQEQLDKLEIEFMKQQYMVGSERSYLAKSLNLTESQVKIWFQNRRIKFRKLNEQNQLNCSNYETNQNSNSLISSLNNSFDSIGNN